MTLLCFLKELIQEGRILEVGDLLKAHLFGKHPDTETNCADLG